MTSTASAAAPPVSGRPPVTRVVPWHNGNQWDAFVAAASDGTVAHRWAWLRIVKDTYGHDTYPLAAVRGGRLVGVLPLVLVRSRLYGRRLVSMPYLDCGGICAAGDVEAEQQLLKAAVELATELHGSLELRHRTARSYPLPVSTHKVSMILDLGGGESAVWQQIKSNRRGQVRKARRNGLDSTMTGEDGVSAFFDVLATNMRDLGSPVHRRSFFQHIVRALGEDARIQLVRQGDAVVGAGLLLIQGDTTVLPFSSALRSSFALGTNQLLYWDAIRYALERGCQIFDFGRSSPDSGTYEAKREWAARPSQLYWYGSATGSADPSRAGQFAVRIWKRLPVPVATAGGYLIRGGLAQ
jgi:FemAB-related protein (PEP-CTERM system-associated)